MHARWIALPAGSYTTDSPNELRRQARNQLGKRFDPYIMEDLEISLKSIPYNTPKSVDKWTKKSIQATCPLAKQEFVNHLNTCVTKLAWPYQLL